jgi:hypothetical protein
MTGSATDVDQFYQLLYELSDRLGGPRQLGQCHGRMGWPKRGVYFFFEPGETRPDGTPRVVRVGTHAIDKETNKGRLWTRLRQHRGQVGGRRPGGGNHRVSIFRQHVGASLLSRDPELAADPGLAFWGHKGPSLPPWAKVGEAPHEQRVSRHIGLMPFLWLPLDDDPGPNSDRGRIESGSIALLSTLANPFADPPSPTWLGHHSPNLNVAGSGLWNDRHVLETPTPQVLTLMHDWIHKA